jgi:glycerol-3-phosphate cytidylyltransferase
MKNFVLISLFSLSTMLANESACAQYAVFDLPNESGLMPVRTGNETPLDDLLVKNCVPNGSKTVMTFGSYDLFHIGHLNILKRAKSLANGGRLVVGVSSDAFNFSKKGKNPIIPQDERLALVQSCKFVDAVFLEEAMEKKVDYLKAHHADILVMGDDWEGKFDNICDGVQSIYFPRTKNISTTELIEKIQHSEQPICAPSVPISDKPFVPHQFDPNLPLALYQLVSDFQSIMDAHQIPFFFYGGTLLGAVRNQGLIPWDDDADCCLFSANINQFIMQVIPVLVRFGYEVSLDEGVNRVFRVINFKHGRIKTALDIFFMPFNNVEERYICNIPHKTLTKEKIFPLRKLQFGQVDINVPNDFEDFLTNNFGPGWKTNIKKYNHFFGCNEKEFTDARAEDLLPAGPFGPLLKRIFTPSGSNKNCIKAAFPVTLPRMYKLHEMEINFLSGFSGLEQAGFWFSDGKTVFRISSTNSYIINFEGKSRYIEYSSFILNDSSKQNHILKFHENGFSFKHEAGMKEYTLTMPYFIPSELRINNDSRKLSFFLNSITIS